MIALLRWLLILSVLALSVDTAAGFAFPTTSFATTGSSVTPSATTTALSAATSSDTSSDISNAALPLKDCVCLVTGASRGIGKGIALELGRAGASVYITGTSSTDKKSKKKKASLYTTDDDTGGPGTIEGTAEQVTEAGGTGIPVYCNHADDDQVQALMDTIQEKHGRLDILVNNVFRIPPGAPKTLMRPFWEQGAETWDTVHTIGLRSHFVATCLAMPLLQKAQQSPLPNMPRPLIAMISSFGGLSYSFNTPYGVAKAAVDRMAKDMAVELGEDMCVASLYPGLVMTERTERTRDSGEWDEFVQLPLIDGLVESPRFTGQAIVALATDPGNAKRSGQVQVVAELAAEYDFDDVATGFRPPSIRSLRFLLPTYGMTEEQRKSISLSSIPDWKLPFWVMAMGKPPTKDE